MWYGIKIIVDENGLKSVYVDDGKRNIFYKDISEYNDLVKNGKATPPLSQLEECEDPQLKMI